MEAVSRRGWFRVGSRFRQWAPAGEHLPRKSDIAASGGPAEVVGEQRRKSSENKVISDSDRSAPGGRAVIFALRPSADRVL